MTGYLVAGGIVLAIVVVWAWVSADLHGFWHQLMTGMIGLVVIGTAVVVLIWANDYAAKQNPPPCQGYKDPECSVWHYLYE